VFLYRVIWRTIASSWTAELGSIYDVIIMCRLSYMADYLILSVIIMCRLSYMANYLILRVIIMCDITTDIS